jgi:hypothetical protein
MCYSLLCYVCDGMSICRCSERVFLLRNVRSERGGRRSEREAKGEGKRRKK